MTAKHLLNCFPKHTWVELQKVHCMSIVYAGDFTYKPSENSSTTPCGDGESNPAIPDAIACI